MWMWVCEKNFTGIMSFLTAGSLTANCLFMLEAIIIAACLLLIFWARTLIKARQIMYGDFVLGREWADKQDGELDPVSVIVPARNEEDNIRGCVSSLLSLDYPELEVVVVNDRSEDDTLRILRELSKSDDRLKIVEGSELPEGWCGKTHALHQGIMRAGYDWFLMTDADTEHKPWSLKAAMAMARKQNLQALSLYPRLDCRSFWEKLLQPSVAALIENFVPLSRVNEPSDPLAWANGQYMLMSRKSLDATGGWQGVRSKILEDVAMADAIKRKGIPYKLLLADRLFTTRMYSNLSEIVRGWSKNVFLAMGKHISAAIMVILFTIIVTWVPLLGLLSGIVLAPGGDHPVLSLLAFGQYFFVLGVQAYVRSKIKLYPVYSLLAPVGALIVSFIVALSAYNHLVKKEILWKGRRMRDS
ncbi:MAG: glycosyltransferase [Deltaproteobacteria bacterium]|nr:glycosyltransferase [Deltaproteobacteria bacterium]